MMDEMTRQEKERASKLNIVLADRTSTFYLIRHAEAKINLVDVVGGRTNDSPLTRKGYAQSVKLGKRLRDIKFDHILCSPAIRTVQTMCISLSDRYGTNIKVLEDLQELSQGEWEGKPRKEIYTPEVLAVINRDHWNFTPPGGESQNMTAKRNRNVLEKEANEKPGVYFVFSHGGAIKYLITDVLGQDRNGAWKVPIENTSITKVRYGFGIWKLEYMNDFSHLNLS